MIAPLSGSILIGRAKGFCIKVDQAVAIRNVPLIVEPGFIAFCLASHRFSWRISGLSMRANAIIIILLKGSSLREILPAEQILESRVGLEHIEFARAANLQKRIGVFCVGFLQPGHCQILFTKRSVLPC
jgi:hypothetical protein